MTVRIITIPDDQTQWPGWLEQQLVGSHLRDLIEELRIVNGLDSSFHANTPLGEILTEKQLADIAASGIAAVGVPIVSELMSNPDALLDLQEYVLINGGSYWQNVPVDSQLKSLIERVRTKLAAGRGSDELSNRQTSVDGKPSTTKRYSLAWVASVAAMLLIGVFVWRMQPHSSGHILGTPGLVTNNTVSSAEYLQRIANAGENWFQEDRSETPNLMALLEDTSHDCQILINARHDALTPEERDWFVTKCRKWKGEFDATLASLKSGTITVETARSQSDLTMTKLVAALRSGPTA